jgi:hypothetical protein
MSRDNVTRPSNAGALLAIGAVLVVLGVAGIVTWIVVAATAPPSADPQETGATQSLLVIGAALSTGLGLVLLSLGVIKRRKR